MNQDKRVLRHWPRTGVLAAAIGTLITTGGISTTVLGQDAESSSSQTDTIIVTGTRIRRDDFSAAQATTVVTADDMRALGVVSVADMVNQLPNNIATITPESTADSPFFLGASIANLRGLNPAFGTRTLTLLDSRRMAPTNNSGSVDMNFIPSALVGRIETVTGGASATYGADAMAGVVNVILDDSIENIRLDLNYATNSGGHGDQYTMSVATGFQFFENNRGRLTVGLDSSRQEGIEDCMVYEICQRGVGLLRNGSGENVRAPHGIRSDQIFDGEGEWMVLGDHHFSTTTEGVIIPLNAADSLYPCAVMTGGVVDTSGCTTPASYRLGWYRFNDEGTDLIPYYTEAELTAAAAPLPWGTADQLYAAINFIGVQTGAGGTSFQGSGNRWATPWGAGRGIYEDVPVLPETDRDNLFLRFTYELEGGIEIGADLTYGNTESQTPQNAARNNLQSFCVMPVNAYLQEGMAGDLLRNVFAARYTTGGQSNTGAFPPSQGGCRQAPFLGYSYNDRDDQIAGDVGRIDYPPGQEFHKDFSQQIDHRNTNQSDAVSLTLTANGSLFEGGSWTWDAYAQFGRTENNQTLTGFRAGRRFDMALDSVIDGWDTNGDGMLDVQAWNMPDPDDSDTWTQNAMPDGASPVIACGIDAHYAAALSNTGELVNWGDYMRERWGIYFNTALGQGAYGDQVPAIMDSLMEGCTPFNPFGNSGISPEAAAYVFPSLFESTENDQDALSVSFSGDAWRGIGNAGPMRMAAGLDYRVNDTANFADANRFLGADFNFIGRSSPATTAQRLYGDNWAGRATTQEAWVEFDLPLLRDKPGADSLATNLSFRRTENESERISGVDIITTRKSKRSVDSWKASMQWQPVDIMRVRMTRSADTRAPSSNELFATNSFSVENGGLDLTRSSPWRFSYVGAASTGQEDQDALIILEAGNADLQPERSITETLGMVFQPVETIPGLQVSVDYYQTTIESGIRELNATETISACATEIGERWEDLPFRDPSQWVYCNNIEFGPGDPTMEFFGPDSQTSAFGSDILGPDGVTQVAPGSPNPYYYVPLPNGGNLTNILSVAESTINEEDYISEGIDYSVSYFTQLDGGGSINARVLYTRFLRQLVFLGDTFGYTDVSGQTGSSNIAQYLGSFTANYSPTPKSRGNIFMTYSKNAFAVTAQAQYTGAGKIDRQNGWVAPGEVYTYQEYRAGLPFPAADTLTTVAYDDSRKRMVKNNDLPSWTTLNLNFSYDFGRSRFQLDRFESLTAYINIDNVGDRVPTFFSGTGAGGVNASYFSALGRSYRMGVRMEF